MPESDVMLSKKRVVDLMNSIEGEHWLSHAEQREEAASSQARNLSATRK